MNLIAGLIFVFSLGSDGIDSTRTVADSLAEDSSYTAQPRSEPIFFSPAVLDSFRKSSEFDYHEVPQNSISFLDILRRWFYETFLAPLEGTVAGSLLGYIFYGVILVVSIWLLMKFFNIDTTGIFRPSSPSEPKLIFHESMISSDSFDFEKEIRLAVESDDFSKAVELEYIFSISILNQEKVITWSPEKTNHDFCNEISDHQLKQNFKYLTTLFEYVWYGDFQIDRPLFSDIQNSFKTFRDGIPSFTAKP